MKPLALLQALGCAIVLGLLGAADYYGFAVFGETPQQQQFQGSQPHMFARFHK